MKCGLYTLYVIIVEITYSGRLSSIDEWYAAASYCTDVFTSVTAQDDSYSNAI